MNRRSVSTRDTSPQLRGLVFDVDGTLADTEEAHRQAFNTAFRAQGLGWDWDRGTYTRLLTVSGGKERLRHHIACSRDALGDLDAAGLDATLSALHAAKTAAYERLVRDGGLALRPGVPDLIEAAGSAGLQLAIATTTTPANIDALLGGTLGSGWRALFAVVEDASTAPLKKPHPQVYVQALAGLGLAAAECLAFEDSDNGLRAARGAGIATIITPTAFTEGQDFSGAARVLPDLATLTIDELLCWHANAVRGSIGTHNNT
jgi:HAD superfamily hydrolase (TIGR01509 family)